jgi:hypothetical protein
MEPKMLGKIYALLNPTLNYQLGLVSFEAQEKYMQDWSLS